MPKCKCHVAAFILFSLSGHAVGINQSKGPECVLCSSRFSSNKGALKELFVVLFVNTCLKRRPKENLKKNYLVSFFCISSTAIYNLVSWANILRRLDGTEMCCIVHGAEALSGFYNWSSASCCLTDSL